MVMTAGSGRIRRPSALIIEGNKELNANGNLNEAVVSPPIEDKIEFLTNDQGDLFYQPKTVKHNSSPAGRSEEHSTEKTMTD